MHTQHKIALAFLSFALALPALQAKPRPQDDPPAPNPDATQQQPPDGPGGPERWDGSRERGNWGGPGRNGWNRGSGHDGWRGGRMGMHGHGMFGGDLLLARLVNDPSLREQLGITADQAAKIRQQTLGFRESEIRGRADIQIKQLELNDLLAADNPNHDAIDQKLEEISAAQLAQAKAAVDFHLAMHSALTPEQRQKLQQMQESFHRHGSGANRRAPAGMRPGSPQAPPAAPSDGN